MRRRWMATALFVLSGIGGSAQESALLTTPQYTALYTRTLQLMDSTMSSVPGLARAAAPVMENTRQAVANLKIAPTQPYSPMHLEIVRNVRAYLALADALPKPFPFPGEAKRQFAELRESVDRAETSFAAMLEVKETQLRSPDRDNLKRYAEANNRLQPPAAGKPRVVFLGDSITDGWRLNEYFPDQDYVNRGISGQITSQMLARMKSDVIDLQPEIAVLLGGTNDLARGISVETVTGNIALIADLCAYNKIKLIIASVLPVSDYHMHVNPAFEISKRRPPQQIEAINRWAKEFAEQRAIGYLDYASALKDERGMLKADLADDGLHPNAAGYRVMAPLVQAAIDQAAKPAPPPAKKKRKLPF
ncbi:MAG TPA: SGNH/GDSL hydrolase family protein [Bryobacteraceae bacterium]|nr:SGNH/GDSL hydrolase family protein [Bryobacteraceae bacterium]